MPEFAEGSITRSGPAGRFTEAEAGWAAQLAEARRRMLVMTVYLRRAVAAALCILGRPPARYLHIVLGPGARPRPVPLPAPAQVLEVDVPCDLVALCDLPVETEALGRAHLALGRAALDKLRDVEGFPVGAFAEGLDAFERADFALWLRAGEKTITGTRLMGRVAVRVTPAGTERWLVLSHRGTVLVETVLGRRDEPDFDTSTFFSGFALAGTVLSVGDDRFAMPVAGRPPLWPPETVDLRDHPEVLALAREKGWIAP